MTSGPIICVTPNVALDRTLVVPDFAIGHISRIDRGVAVPGGKGLNTMRAIQILGGDALSMGLMGGHTGRMVAAMVEEAGYRAEWTWFEGESRTCTIIATVDGRSTVINESGRVQPEDWNALVNDICHAAVREAAYAVCLCGSLPTGAPENAPADLIVKLMQTGVPVWVDTSKRALDNAIDASPYAIKVNRDEIAAVMNIAADSCSDLVAAARSLLTRGIRLVVISLGKDGALLVSADLVAKATPPQIQALDPVASGDCLHAGIVESLARSEDHVEALRRGVAAGTVNALYAGGGRFTYAHFQEILRQTAVELLSA